MDLRAPKRFMTQPIPEKDESPVRNGVSFQAASQQNPLLCAALGGEFLLLLFASFFGDPLIPGNLQCFVPLMLAAGGCYLLALSRFEHAGAAGRPALMWGAAIVLRLAVLIMPPADDLWRYVWEGKIQLEGFNPYLVSPNARFLAALRDGWCGCVDHRDFAALYPPGGEWIFAHLMRTARSYAIAPMFLPLLFKSVFALADIGTIWLLLKLNTGSARYRATAWYAWNPAVVAAFAGAGHYDSLMLFALVSAAWMLHRANPLGACKPAWGWVLASSTMLGLAIAIKPAPIVLLPVWAMALGRRSIALGLAVAVPLGLALPYGGIDVVTQTLRGYMNVARFNDLSWWAVERLLWANPEHRNLRYAVILAVTVLILAWVFRKDWRRGALWSMGAALIMAPLLQPWYVTWVLPFACWRKAWPWFILALTMLLAMPWWNAPLTQTAWEGPSAWVRLAIVGVPLALMTVARWRKGQ